MDTSPVQPLTDAQIAEQVKEDLAEGRVHRTLVELDEAGNVLLGGKTDQTISTTSGIDDQEAHGLKQKIAYVLDRTLEFISPDHPMTARIADYVRAVTEAKYLRSQLDETTITMIDKFLNN